MINSEKDLMIACINWVTELEDNYPICHIRNHISGIYKLNRKTGHGEVIQNPNMGMADMTLIVNGKIYYVEFKYKRGKQTENQILFERLVTKAGAKYYLVYNIEDFKMILLNILSLEYELK